MWQCVEQVLQSAKILRKNHFRQIAVICIAAEIPLALGFILQSTKPYTGILVQLLSLGMLRYVMNLLSGQTSSFLDIFFIFTSFRRFGKAALVIIVCFLPAFSMLILRNALTILLYVFGIIWLSIMRYQLALEPEISVKNLFMSVGKMRGNCLRYFLLLFILQLRFLVSLVAALLLGFVFGSALAILGIIFVLLWTIPYIYLGEGIFMYQNISGKPVRPKATEEQVDMLLKVSECFNSYSGLRANAALDVLAGPSPATLIPPPEGCDIPEDVELPQDEDWEALYGALDTPEATESAMDGEVNTEPIRLSKAVLSGSVEAQSLDDLKAELLLAQMEGLSHFVREKETIQKLFQKTLKNALEELRACEGTERAGIAADRKRVDGNRYRLVIRVLERTWPLNCEATAELFANE